MKAVIKILMLSACLVLVGCAAQQQSAPLDGASASTQNSDGMQAEAAADLDTLTANTPSTVDNSDESFFEDYGEDQDISIADPLEPWNRMWFSFNDFVLLQIVRPLYTGYEFVTPKELRSGLSNVLYNAQMPVRLANRLLQGEFGQAWVELGRFIINSTVGIGGLIDVAQKDRPLVPMDESGADFGQTLAKWGVGEGIYLVWPLVGPSTARDTVGLGGDYLASPFFWLVEPTGNLVPFWTGSGVSAGLRFNNIKGAIDAYELLTKSAVEPYVAARDAYVKFRRATLYRTPVTSVTPAATHAPY